MDMKVEPPDEFIELGRRIREENEKLKRAGVLVTEASEGFDEQPDKVLFDMDIDGKALFENYRAHSQHFATAPFDPQGRLLRLYPGGITIWSGFPGSGKTALLRQFVCHLLKPNLNPGNGPGVFLASLEEDPRRTLVELAATAEGSSNPSQDGIDWFLDTYVDRFHLWGRIGIARHTQLLAVIRELAEQGVKHAIIDSLMCLDVANDDFESQRKFANLVAATARASNIHIHLVAHPRKLVSANQELDLNDVAGARELSGVADNVLFIRRSSDSKDMGPGISATPMNISIRKQRHFNGAHGQVTGWYQREFRQFTIEQFQERPISYLPDEAIKYLRRMDSAAVKAKLQ